MRKLKDAYRRDQWRNIAMALPNVQSLYHHDKPSSHPRTVPRGEPLRRQLCADAGRLSGLSRAGIRKRMLARR